MYHLRKETKQSFVAQGPLYISLVQGMEQVSPRNGEKSAGTTPAAQVPCLSSNKDVPGTGGCPGVSYLFIYLKISF